MKIIAANMDGVQVMPKGKSHQLWLFHANEFMPIYPHFAAPWWSDCFRFLYTEGSHSMMWLLPRHYQRDLLFISESARYISRVCSIANSISSFNLQSALPRFNNENLSGPSTFHSSIQPSSLIVISIIKIIGPYHCQLVCVNRLITILYFWHLLNKYHLLICFISR